jgi:hypothetical protein
MLSWSIDRDQVMLFLLQPFQIVLAVLSEFIRKEQEKVIEYLQLENQILLEKIASKRVLLNDDQRRLLAVKGKALGRKQLAKIATIAQADTILRWHRELIEPGGNSNSSHNIGRPTTDQEIVDLVLRMARENVSWGYQRIASALHNLGYAICSSTVANILKQHGIEPAPSRQRTISWSIFFKSHWEAFEGIDLDAIRLWIIELARVIFGCGSNSRSTSCATAAKSDDETPNPTIFVICIPQVPDVAAHPARPPPIPPGTNTSRDIRRAA